MSTDAQGRVGRLLEMKGFSDLGTFHFPFFTCFAVVTVFVC